MARLETAHAARVQARQPAHPYHTHRVPIPHTPPPGPLPHPLHTHLSPSPTPHTPLPLGLSLTHTTHTSLPHPHHTQAFGASYLRLEDYHCWWVASPLYSPLPLGLSPPTHPSPGASLSPTHPSPGASSSLPLLVNRFPLFTRIGSPGSARSRPLGFHIKARKPPPYGSLPLSIHPYPSPSPLTRIPRTHTIHTYPSHPHNTPPLTHAAPFQPHNTIFFTHTTHPYPAWQVGSGHRSSRVGGRPRRAFAPVLTTAGEAGAAYGRARLGPI